MAAKQKHRTAGNTYNLRRKVEIPIELQFNNDNAFMNEFASQPEPGQSSKSRSDTDSNTSIVLQIGTLLSQESEDSVEESPVHVQTKKFKKSDRPSRFKNSRSREVMAGSQLDQTLINERILSQLDAIGKRLTAIEQSSASAARPKAKKVAVRGTASSSLNGSFFEGDLVKKLPDLHTLRHDRSVQDQVEARIRQLSNNDVKGTDPKYKSQRGGAMDIFVKARVKWPHEFVLAGSTKDRITYNQLNVTQWMSGFCRILRDKNCQNIRDHMLDYLIALLDDSNDFLRHASKTSHAVLLCRMEQGEVMVNICSTCFAQDGKISVHNALDCKTKKFKKRLTLGIVDKATWQPDCVQDNAKIFCINQKFVERHVFNSSFCRKTVVTECQASRREWTEWFNTSNSYKPVVAGKSFADVVRANLGQKGHGQVTPLVGTQVASKLGEPLELFKEDVKLSHNTLHHAPRQEIRSCKTTKNCPNENIIVCNNRFAPLMEENLFSDDFDMLECEIQAVDTAPANTGPTVSSFHNENLLDCDKFDKALLKELTLVSSCRQAHPTSHLTFYDKG